ncbi:acyl-CoA thioesterase-1 [Pedobacter suwonensis]|uniref:Acyl-CoA thioesterase-1 n=1 Tax=Pedobacter suwonensis TaxID=332999 RepID=A0A1I0TRD3_9SPHI|nr:arylesterase [Pedobacter suwonensis]SFA54272.1 acyl-CoA thioesterase-1 [Pedobacter suwonensis]
MENKIVFFGDSLVAGYGLKDPFSESIPALTNAKLKELGLKYTVINAGLSGDTTASALSRLGQVLNENPAIFVLELGANDFLRGISSVLIRSNLQLIINKVKTSCPSASILLLGIELPDWATGWHQSDYSGIFPALAEKNGLSMVPSFLKNVAGIRELNMYDGVHPLKEGYEIAAENIWPELYRIIQERGSLTDLL